MAFDKVVDSSELEAGLTLIADAIREKGGTSDTLAFPDAMAEAIAAIEASENVAVGSITPIDTTVSQLEITHNLGSTPELIFICAASAYNSTYSASSPTGFSFIYAVYLKDSLATGIYGAKYQLGSTNSTNYVSGQIYGTGLGTGIKYYIVANEQKIILANRNSSYGFGKEAVPLVWVVMKELPA